MTNYWKSKVLPKIKKVFEKNSVKKAAATEATKIFDESKEVYNKEFEEKKADLQPKVVEIYEASSTEIKSLIKEPKDAGLKKHSAEVQKLLDDLANIEFPGSKPVAEACSKFGAAYVSGPVLFVFEKVSTFVVTEDKKEETEEAPPATTTTEEATTTTTTTTAEEIKEKEIVIEEEKKEEAPAPAPAAADKTEAPAAEPAAPVPSSTEPAKVEEAPPAPAPAAPAPAEAPAPAAPAPAPAAPVPAAPAPAATEPAKP